MKTQFITLDGKTFKDKDGAIAHESNLFAHWSDIARISIPEVLEMLPHNIRHTFREHLRAHYVDNAREDGTLPGILPAHQPIILPDFGT